MSKTGVSIERNLKAVAAVSLAVASGIGSIASRAEAKNSPRRNVASAAKAGRVAIGYAN